MKRLLVFVSALMLVGVTFAADKVVQSSSRHTPKWLGGMEEGYFMVAGRGENLDEAQQDAMTHLREEIISAIATQVHSSTSIVMWDVADNGTLESHHEIVSKMSVKAADIPYLAEISPSHASDYYWAKMRRPDKSTYYYYHIRYPLSNAKLHSLVAEYDKQQKGINDTLQAFASLDMAELDDLSQMLSRHASLKQFAATLHEDDARREICNAIRQNYERMISQNIHIEIVKSNRESTEVALTYGTKRISYSIIPKVKSNCLTALQSRTLGNGTLISYDFETGCYEEDQNWLDITFTILSKKLNTRCYIK